MAERPPSAKARIAALQKLSASYATATLNQRREMAVEYLFEVADLLVEMHGSEDVLAPLLDIIPYVVDPKGSARFEERRKSGGTGPSDAMMARVSACLDVLIEQGHTPEKAAQNMTRQIVREGAALPDDGNDIRAWKRLLYWRERLISLKKPPRAVPQFQEFKARLLAMPRRQMLDALNDGAIWNERKPK